MTRDEAKEILAGRYIVNIDGDDEYCDKVNEALDMAIEALSNQQKWIEEELQNYLIEHAELVTCKDCKMYDPKYTDREYDCPIGLYAVYGNDFCSHAVRAERRE